MLPRSILLPGFALFRFLRVRTGGLRRFSAGRVLLFRTDDYGAGGLAARLFVPNHGCGSAMVFFMSDHGRGEMMFSGEDDDLVRPVVPVTRRRRPPRTHGRTRCGPCPIPFVIEVEPAFIIRDIFIPVKDIVVFRDDDFLGLRHDDRAGRGRDDLLRRGDHNGFFHDDRLFHDPRRRFHDNRSRTRLDDRADQIHDVRRKPDAVGRRFVVIPCKGGGRGEDNRRSESGADHDCLVDGLLSSVSFGKRGCWFSVRKPVVLDFLIILYYEIFVMSNGFLNFFRKKFRLSSKKTEKRLERHLE